MNVRAVWAGGGVLWRPSAIHPEQPEIAVIHRPRYDDWTLPKGKTEPRETVLASAVREIAEETGYSVVLGRHLRQVTYALNGAKRKHVRYWAARATGGEFAPNKEVDDLRWLAPEAARTVLTYTLDRLVVDEFLAKPADLHTFLLVRHAKAGRRARYRGADPDRPLERYGRLQAEALADMLALFGVKKLYAADRARCVQTLEPLAKQLGGRKIHIEPSFSEEAYAEDPEAAHKRIVALAAKRDAVRVVCSQGKAIAPLMQWWAQRDGFALPPNRNRKASTWVLSIDHDGRVVDVEHIDDPLPDFE
ncbi:NUDIX hydrolase [Gordonia crocea]|uniref:Putative 8-oxo-dGTP diphosphatase 1 n=1 Tax=Gordonia crocea TaxID=589162 RepID=A0A7I9UZ09_9ACTN|nr:NUDIX hydrolase [Gordonia crocea]GED98408.1 putative 8-oxo-dGTP diphosphatase 1 [Gordonia crocea]